MLLERYEIEHSEDFLSFSFYSNGPNGIIKKIVKFDLITSSIYHLYNLGFGDANEFGETINDTKISNNMDTEKVLASVAHIVLMFSQRYPESLIFIRANTESKMRLYQMKINKYLNEIDLVFEIKGFVHEIGLIPYKPGNKCLFLVGSRKLK